MLPEKARDWDRIGSRSLDSCSGQPFLGGFVNSWQSPSWQSQALLEDALRAKGGKNRSLWTSSSSHRWCNLASEGRIIEWLARVEPVNLGRAGTWQIFPPLASPNLEQISVGIPRWQRNPRTMLRMGACKGRLRLPAEQRKLLPRRGARKERAGLGSSQDRSYLLKQPLASRQLTMVCLDYHS